MKIIQITCIIIPIDTPGISRQHIQTYSKRINIWITCQRRRFKRDNGSIMHQALEWIDLLWEGIVITRGRKTFKTRVSSKKLVIWPILRPVGYMKTIGFTYQHLYSSMKEKSQRKSTGKYLLFSLHKMLLEMIGNSKAC